MTQEELRNSERKLKEEYESNIKTLRLRFALANNTVKTGDIIESDYANIRIKVDSFKLHHFNNPPCFIYEGIKLTKKNEPVKIKQKRDLIYQYNMTSIIQKANEK